MSRKNQISIDVDEIMEPNILLRTYILFIQTARDVMRYVDARLYREGGSSMTQLIVLQALYFKNSAMTPSDISAWTQTETHNITTLIRRMQRDRLVELERSRGNKRIVKVRLSEKGREKLMHIMPVSREIVDLAMSSLSAEEATLLEHMLKNIRLSIRSGLDSIYNQQQHHEPE